MGVREHVGRRSPAGVLGAGWLLAYVIGLTFVPRLVPVPQDVASAAAVSGYHTGVAYLVAAGLTLLGILTCAVLAHRERLLRPSPEAGAGPARDGRRSAAIELGLLFVVFALAYFPPFLARYGPYSEDHIYLNLLHRMAAGQHPYVDFEFLYGPLLVWPVHAWMQLFGYSMKSYYALTALMEAVQAVVVMAVLRRFIPRAGRRWLVFLLLQPFLLNVLLGVNWNGLRRLVPALVLLVLAHGPLRPRIAFAAAGLLGLQLAYSHDYGLAALAAAGAVYGFELLRGSRRAVPMGLAFAGLSLAIGGGLASLTLGGELGDWLALARELMARYDAGEAGFAFVWTLNGLAAFAMLVIAGIAVGRGLPAAPRRAIVPGDRLLLAAVAYATVALKSGLNRSDFWHLDAALLPLALALLLPLARESFPLTMPERFRARATVVAVSLTALLGLLPIGSHVARGWLAGARDVLSGRPAGGQSHPGLRGPSIQFERSEPDPDILALGAWLADDGRASRPVVYYGLTWALGKELGIPRTEFLNDDFLYSDARAIDLRRHIDEQPGVLVVIHRFQYERLFGLVAPDRFPELDWLVRPSAIKRIARWTTSNHYDAVPLETRVRDARYARHAGALLTEQFVETARFGDLIVLERSAENAEGKPGA